MPTSLSFPTLLRLPCPFYFPFHFPFTRLLQFIPSFLLNLLTYLMNQEVQIFHLSRYCIFCQYPITNEALSACHLPVFSTAFTHTINFSFGPGRLAFVSVNGPIEALTVTEFWRFFSAVWLVRVTAEAAGAEPKPTERAAVRGAPTGLGGDGRTGGCSGLASITGAVRRLCLVPKVNGSQFRVFAPARHVFFGGVMW